MKASTSVHLLFLWAPTQMRLQPLKYKHRLVKSTKSQIYLAPIESWGQQSSLEPPYHPVFLELLWINTIQWYWYIDAYHFIFVLFFCSAFILLYLAFVFILLLVFFISASHLFYLCYPFSVLFISWSLACAYLVSALHSLSSSDHSSLLTEFSISTERLTLHSSLLLTFIHVHLNCFSFPTFRIPDQESVIIL